MSIGKVKASPNYERIKNSLELRVTRNYSLYFAAAAGLSALAVYLLNFRLDAGIAAVTAGFMLVVLLPFSLYYACRICKIFQDIDAYTFTEVTLSKFHSSWLHRQLCFSVEVKDLDGNTVRTETNTIFHAHGLMKPLLEDYVNRTVLVAYNNSTGYVAIIE